MHLPNLILKLHEINALKFGTFNSNGIDSPFRIDLRLVVSFPEILQTIGELVWKKIQPLNFDLLCGVPYTAMVIATGISLAHNKPMVMRRKEIKDQGTKKIIEGSFTTGQTCLVIEDLITSGNSILETIEPLEKEGLTIRDAAVLIDREQGGQMRLAKQGYNLHAVFTVSEMMHLLENRGRVEKGTTTKVLEFLKHQYA